MSPTLDAALRSWPFDPWLLAALLLTAGVYLRGWLVLRRRLGNPKHEIRSPKDQHLFSGFGSRISDFEFRMRWHGPTIAGWL